jgi:hypothetical protein
MRFYNYIRQFISTIREINRKYANPTLKTGKGVKFALLVLRLYLILLVGLLFFKFFTALNK